MATTPTASTRSTAVYVEGLDELIRDFRRIDKSMAKQLTDTLRPLARSVRDKAKVIAKERGFGQGARTRGAGGKFVKGSAGRSGRGTGALIRGMGISVRGASAYVLNKAERTTGTKPFRYPAVYEFGQNSPWNRSGDRSFLQPALDIMRPQIVEGIEEMLDDLLE